MSLSSKAGSGSEEDILDVSEGKGGRSKGALLSKKTNRANHLKNEMLKQLSK